MGRREELNMTVYKLVATEELSEEVEVPVQAAELVKVTEEAVETKNELERTVCKIVVTEEPSGMVEGLVEVPI